MRRFPVMNKRYIFLDLKLNLIAAAAFVALAFLPAAAQKTAINETNVRGEMYFLASDAMQGRGRAGPFERVAAEYIGSQFMQFGLEPAGDGGFDGKPTFVQAVTFKRRNGDEVKTYNA
ncbi:MAG TPA: hypothetical protein VL501_03050, partial [Pyrinomonadaceae bacterium]|nr:hypothetical protein [Pyrinomonadaceae bacterium]